MSALSRIIPETVSDMASVPSMVKELAESSTPYVLGNRLLKRIQTIREAVLQYRSRLQELPLAIQEMSDVDLDTLIDKMSSMELGMVELRAGMKAHAKRFENESASDIRKTQVRRLALAADQVFLEFLRFMRDSRWEVMAIRSEREAPGTGPVISSEDDLKDFFNSLSSVDAD